MNNVRRKQIKDIVNKLQDIQSDINLVMDDEQYAYDSMSEGLKNTEKGMNSEESIELLEDAYNSLGECIDSLIGIS